MFTNPAFSKSFIKEAGSSQNALFIEVSSYFSRIVP
jgi:hypothetical protein